MKFGSAREVAGGCTHGGLCQELGVSCAGETLEESGREVSCWQGKIGTRKRDSARKRRNVCYGGPIQLLLPNSLVPG